MRKKHSWIVFVLLAVLLAACGETEDQTGAPQELEVDLGQDALGETGEELEEEQAFEPLSSEEIEEIVINNLEQMDASQDAFDYYETMTIVDETIRDPNQDTEEVRTIVEETKEQLTHLVSEKNIDDWTRSYLSVFYWTMSRQHLHPDDIHARFEVLQQSQKEFKVSFITLADEGGYHSAGTHQLDYVQEQGHWVFREAEFIPAQDKPLYLTMDEVEEKYARHDKNSPDVLANFEVVEAVEVDGENYLVYQAYDRYHVRDVLDSGYNYELSEHYNAQSES